MVGNCLVVVFLTGLSTVATAQKADPKEPQNIELGKTLLKKAIDARGGAKYVNFKTLQATGQYTPFENGLPSIPVRFLDLIVFPDKERVEFGKGKKKDLRIQVNVGKTGWVYDGDAETLKDQTDAQIASYLEGLEYDLDRILRGGWMDPGVEIGFAGRQETRPGERADVVAIQLDPEKILYLLLDQNTHLPISLTYEKTDGQGLTRREVKFFQFVSYDGVKFPNIVDFYRNGVQESRVNYQTVKVDIVIEDGLFTKPASVKAIK